MGLPETPEENRNSDTSPLEVRPDNMATVVPIPSEDEESDNERPGVNNFGGYELLAQGANGEFIPTAMNDDDDDYNDSEGDNEASSVPEAQDENNFPTVDAQIESEVWSSPRPKELNYELDSSKTQEILNVMSKITLPNCAIPEWAQQISEESWKQDLLQKIRNKTNGPDKV